VQAVNQPNLGIFLIFEVNFVFVLYVFSFYFLFALLFIIFL